MMGTLDDYRAKRDFRRTPEPSGEAKARRAKRDGIFVIQKHAASRLHFDLRLEQDGVLRSWAVPKGPSIDPGEKRLAVEVEDHPLSYGDFEGVIPQGEYGGGTVMLWDRGHWRRAGKATKDHLDFELDGERLKGSWSLVRMRGKRSDDGKNWLLIKRSDDDAADLAEAEAAIGPKARSIDTGRTMEEIAADLDATWTSEGRVEAPPAEAPPVDDVPGAKKGKLPRQPKPQLATRVDDAPQGDDWLSEIKFDGYRVLARVERGSEGEQDIRILTRNGKDWTERFGTIAARLRGLPAREALIDGEVVAYSTGGSTSFAKLQEALSAGTTSQLVFQAFDLLHLDGASLTGAPLVERKRVLRALLDAAGMMETGAVRYTDHVVGKAPEFYAQACEIGLEGIIVKRADARYRAGRGTGWLKVKCTRHRDLLIGGFTDPQGSRTGFGALLMGAYDGEGALRYAGKVGTGFDDRQLAALHATLQDLETDDPPFADPPRGKGIHWVRPEQIAHIEFTEWTRDGALRHPVFQGLREDLDPAQIRLPNAAEGETMTEGDTMAEGEGMAMATEETEPQDRSTRRTRRAADDESVDEPQAARRKRRAPTAGADRAHVAGVNLSSPDKVLYPQQGVSKRELAEYYASVGEWMLPYVQDRPLALVRCPQGREKKCFYQKHPGEAMAKDLPRVTIEESDGPAPYLYVQRPEHLVQLVQSGVLEMHVWGSLVGALERPDILVFDLDPADDVPWAETIRIARELRDRLDGMGLVSFPRTTGGKGLHLVVPIEPTLEWPEAKAFAQAVAQAHAQDEPKRITTNMSKAKRGGKIFLDYLRNGRGATAIASYSTRAREGAPVAVPIRWDELGPRLTSDRYHVGNVARRLGSLKGDPWEGFADARREITARTLDAL